MANRTFRQIKIIHDELLNRLEDFVNDFLYETEHEVVSVDIRFDEKKQRHEAIVHLLCTEEETPDT